MSLFIKILCSDSDSHALFASVHRHSAHLFVESNVAIVRVYRSDNILIRFISTALRACLLLKFCHYWRLSEIRQEHCMLESEKKELYQICMTEQHVPNLTSLQYPFVTRNAEQKCSLTCLLITSLRNSLHWTLWTVTRNKQDSLFVRESADRNTGLTNELPTPITRVTASAHIVLKNWVANFAFLVRRLTNYSSQILFKFAVVEYCKLRMNKFTTTE